MLIINAERERKLPNVAEAEKYFCRNEYRVEVLQELQDLHCHRRHRISR